ncbi:MAG: ATP-binding protein, partial [Tannerellaceae bacterium]|nr:ATP-binding protein [Tannerellaceae bacterium]
MKLLLENLGVVKKIDLDLSKRLLVFCGPNGTGKTYVSYAVYGYLTSPLFSVDLFNLQELLEKKELNVAIDYPLIDRLTLLNLESLRYTISYIFGLHDKNYFHDFKASISKDRESMKKKFFSFTHDYDNCVITYTKENSNLHIRLDETEQTGLADVSVVSEPTAIYQNSRMRRMHRTHNAIIGKYLCNDSLLNAYILPVERNSVYTFADNLAVNKIKELSVENDNDRYPLPVQDALATAIDLRHIKRQTSPYSNLAEEIENEILLGKIAVSEDGEIQFKPGNAGNIVLPVHLSASIIKNLSGLLIYLKHQAKENDLLIIDEPELGLHPDNQIRLARIFGKLINNGIRLLINTHSDYILRELNNLIMLSSVGRSTKNKMKAWGYSDDEAIKNEFVGAYLFDTDKDAPGSVTVESLAVEKNGFEVKTIDAAINRLNQVSEDIYYYMRYESEERLA